MIEFSIVNVMQDIMAMIAHFDHAHKEKILWMKMSRNMIVRIMAFVIKLQGYAHAFVAGVAEITELMCLLAALQTNVVIDFRFIILDGIKMQWTEVINSNERSS